MTTFMLVTHPERADAIRLTRHIDRLLQAAGHSTFMPDAGRHGLTDIATDVESSAADVVIALGGDGTMLHAVHLLDGHSAPILGINLGNLGYLTEVEPDQVDDALRRVIEGADGGGWVTDERMMLDVTVTDADGVVSPPARALNEVVIEKCQSGHTIHLLLRIDGEPFTTYAADGMIVATPTGSTAYSMSARGPIVSPKHRSTLVTPVAPHMLFDRTMVLDPTEIVEIEITGDRPGAIAVDGRLIAKAERGAIVGASPSNATAKFIRFGTSSYHQVLKTKFGLADR